MEVTDGFGLVIKGLRDKRAWTQEQLAGAANLSNRTVQRIEGGEKPSPETQMALADAFGIEVSQLKEFAEAKTVKAESPEESKENRQLSYELLDRVEHGCDVLRVVFADEFPHFDCEAPASGEESALIGGFFDELRNAPEKYNSENLDRRMPHTEILNYGVELTEKIRQIEKAGFYVFADILYPPCEPEDTDMRCLAYIHIARSDNPKIVKLDDGYMQIPAFCHPDMFSPVPPVGSGFGLGVLDDMRVGYLGPEDLELGEELVDLKMKLTALLVLVMLVLSLFMLQIGPRSARRSKEVVAPSSTQKVLGTASIEWGRKAAHSSWEAV